MKVIEETWGLEETVLETEEYRVKRLTLKPNESLPYVYHTSIGVCWTVGFGDGIIIQDSSELNLFAGTWWILPQGSSYMAKAGSNGLVLLQTETGNISENKVCPTSLFI